MSDFKSSPHQTPMEVTFGDASEDAHEITGSLTVHGPISSSYGATFVGEVIAGSLSISGSTDFGAALSSSGQIQGHSLAIQDGATITGSTVLHGDFSSSYGAIFDGNVQAGSLSVSSSATISGSLTLENSGGDTILTLIDSDLNRDEEAQRYYIKALDTNGDTAWIVGDSGGGEKALVVHAQNPAGRVELATKSSDGGSIVFKPRGTAAATIDTDGTAKFEHLVSSSYGFQAPQHYIAPARDLADIDTTDQFEGTNFDFSGSWITGGARSGQITYTLGVALSASGDGSFGVTGFSNDGTVFTEKDNLIINMVEGSNYGGVGGGTLGGADLSFGVPYVVTYGGSFYSCFFSFTNNLGTPIAADQTFKINFTFI